MCLNIFGANILFSAFLLNIVPIIIIINNNNTNILKIQTSTVQNASKNIQKEADRMYLELNKKSTPNKSLCIFSYMNCI